MTEEEYERLCRACDRILLESGPPSRARTAITWLHVLNEHPAIQAHYQGLLDGRARPLRALRSVAAQARAWWRSRGVADAALPERADVIFVSTLLNEKQAGGEDFYFGGLPERLQREGLRVCVVLWNATPVKEDKLESRWAAPMAPRHVLRRSLDLRTEIALRRELSCEAAKLSRGTAVDSFDRSVRREAAGMATSASAIGALRFHEQFRRIVERLRPRAVVVTYEGHGWERLAFAAAREVTPTAVCVGYHHTIVFPRQHAAMRQLGGAYDPSVILCAGNVSARRFQDAYEASATLVRTMGIHRRQAAAAPPPVKRPARCVVMPDGIYTEIALLSDFAVDAARAAPEMEFVIRLHPIVVLEELLTAYPRLRSLPPNVTFSNRSIDEDFARSRWALYRGSNAAVYGVMAGLRPFYLSRPGELQIDSLNDLKRWKKVVSNVGDLLETMRADVSETSPDLEDASEAMSYSREYFMPQDPGVLSAVLRAR